MSGGVRDIIFLNMTFKTTNWWTIKVGQRRTKLSSELINLWDPSVTMLSQSGSHSIFQIFYIITPAHKMVKADIPETSRDSSPEKVTYFFSLFFCHNYFAQLSVGGLTSRTSSSASSFTVDTTRESSPDYRYRVFIKCWHRYRVLMMQGWLVSRE